MQFGEKRVLDGVDLDVTRGEILAIVGGSGSGKSTLLRLMAMLTRPTAGSIRVFGTEVAQIDDATALPLRKRIGVMFQNGGLFGDMNVLENVGVPLREHTRLSDATIEQIADIRISLVGLDPDAAIKYPGQLSGGMRKRASLARAMALDPEAAVSRRTDVGARSAQFGRDRRTGTGAEELARPHDRHGDPRHGLAVADRRPGRVVGKRAGCGGRNDGRTGEIRSRRRTGILRRPARTRQRTRGGAAVTSKKTYIRIGLFVVVLTTALIWGTLWLSAGGAPGEFDFYTTYMNESVSGLSPDAALTYRGVNVGKVREITIDPNNPESGAAAAAGETRRADQTGHRGDAGDAGV